MPDSVNIANLQTIGPVTQAHNRNLNATAITYAAATNSATWAASLSISALEIIPWVFGDTHFNYAHDSAGTAGVLLVTGPGVVQQVNINTAGTASTLTLYDGLTAGGTVMAVINTASLRNLQFVGEFATGLFYVASTVTPADLTITYTDNHPIGWAVINAPSDAIASSWLADTGSASSDVQYFPIFRDRPCEINTYLGGDNSGAITRVDIATKLANMRYWIGAN